MGQPTADTDEDRPKYPRILVHPGDTSAVLTESPSPFPPVLVHNSDQEEEYRSKGYAPQLSPAKLNLIAFDVRYGKANPGDARRLLAHFCDCVEAGKPVPDRLMEHLKDAFRAYLQGRRVVDRRVFAVRTIDVALGLKLKKGHPAADEQSKIRMAAAVLEKRLTGTSIGRNGRFKAMAHEEAVDEVAEQFGCKKTVVSEAWRNYRTLGRVLFQIKRGPRPLTDGEERRLHRIFPPGKSRD
jgi:hypothetical protein